MSRLAFPICSVAERSAALRDTWPALTGRCCGSPVFVPTTPAASHGVSTLRLSSLYLQYDSNGTFRNVPLLLSHACPCAVRFDAYQFSKTALLDAHHKGGIKQGCFSVLKKTSDCKSNDRVTGAGRGRGSPGCGPGSSTACRCSRRCASRRSSWTGRCCRTAGTSRPAYRPCPL